MSFDVQFLLFFRLSLRGEIDLRQALIEQLADFRRRSGCFSRFSEVAASCRKLIDVWLLLGTELATVAVALLLAPSSEAAVERTFSAQGLVHRKLRNRLHDATVQREMFLSFNHRAIQ